MPKIFGLLRSCFKKLTANQSSTTKRMRRTELSEAKESTWTENLSPERQLVYAISDIDGPGPSLKALAEVVTYAIDNEENILSNYYVYEKFRYGESFTKHEGNFPKEIIRKFTSNRRRLDLLLEYPLPVLVLYYQGIHAEDIRELLAQPLLSDDIRTRRYQELDFLTKVDHSLDALPSGLIMLFFLKNIAEPAQKLIRSTQR